MKKWSFSLLIIGAVILSLSFGVFAKDKMEFNTIEENKVPLESSIVSIQGESIDGSATSLNLQNKKIADYNTFVNELALFPNLTYVDLSNSNLSNEQMENLQNIYPNIKFVWVVHMKHWSMRTDAVAFSTQQWHITEMLNSDDIQVLKYCKDLVALDLGHNRVSDISVMRNLKNLKILILVDNPVTDLSPLKDMSNLMYLEFFVARVTDITPLAYCENLVDLNISFNRISDIDPILHLPHLQRLWFTHTNISQADRQRLIDTYPNVAMDFSSSTSIQAGWRTNPRFKSMRNMYKNNTVEGEFATTTMDDNIALMVKYRDEIFDSAYYGVMNPDVVEKYGADPEVLFNHFIVYGVWENRVASSNFDMTSYIQNHPELVDAYGTYYPKYYGDYLRKFW